MCSYLKTSSPNFDLPRTARLSPALATQMTSRWTMAHTFGAVKRQQKKSKRYKQQQSQVKQKDMIYEIYLWRMHMKKSFQKQPDCDQHFHPCNDLENHHSRKVQSDYHSSRSFLNTLDVGWCFKMPFRSLNSFGHGGAWVSIWSTKTSIRAYESWIAPLLIFVTWMQQHAAIIFKLFITWRDAHHELRGAGLCLFQDIRPIWKHKSNWIISRNFWGKDSQNMLKNT